MCCWCNWLDFVESIGEENDWLRESSKGIIVTLKYIE
jgi:hypothetical protein